VVSFSLGILFYVFVWAEDLADDGLDGKATASGGISGWDGVNGKASTTWASPEENSRRLTLYHKQVIVFSKPGERYDNLGAQRAGLMSSSTEIMLVPVECPPVTS
jgi:hypothetical protein